MIILKILLLLITIGLVGYLILPFTTVLLSLLIKDRKVTAAGKEKDFACVITAYQNIDIALPLIDSLVRQKYQNHLIYLVADECEINQLKIDHPNVYLLKPSTKLGSKVKSIIHAIENFKREHEAIVIFDPDNLATTNFLSVLNNYLSSGYKAVQGKRTAKNLDTIYACADATGEIYKNYIERYVPFILGSSPTIAGSGMAVEMQLFKEYLTNKKIQSSLQKGQVIVAEDKILQNDLVGKGFQIAFAKDAVLYDEKVTEGSQVERQRSRWLYSYFENAGNTFAFVLKGLVGFNFNQFLFGLITSTPPLFVLLLGSLIITVINFFVDMNLFIVMTSAIIIFIGNIFFVLALSKAPKEIWKAMWGIPFFVFKQFLALLKMGRSRKDFMHTQHKRSMTLEEINKR